jgi:hypothetical protein
MSLDADTLYKLLPSIYRIRDDAEGKPLHALLNLLTRELQGIEENIEQLYDDQFIETCADWVAPYIGDLIGYRPLHRVAPGVVSPRAEVANTIAFRRRKGTALMLEQLAQDVTGWPAHAVEFFEQLATTQYMNHTRLHALATADARSNAVMLASGGPFNRVAHTPEVRRPDTGAGRYNIPNVGLFLWRLDSFSVSRVPLAPDPADATGRRFRVNPLGADLRLFRRHREGSLERLAEPINVPMALTVRELAMQVREATRGTARVDSSDDYGAGRSIVLSRGASDEPLRLAGAAPQDDPEERCVVRIADLRDVFDGGGAFVGWAHEDDIAAHQLAIDPERGRVLLGVDRVADHAAEPFVATFHYGFARPLGGGEYERVPETIDAGGLERSASNAEPLQPHLDAIATAGGRLSIADSLAYAQTPTFRVASVTAPNAAGLEVVVAASNDARPLIAASSTMTLDIGARGTLVLDGLTIAGGALELPASADNETRTLILRDCTLVPGLALQPNGAALAPGQPSLIVAHPFTTVRLERCITGPLHIVAESDVTVELVDCIMDACAPELPAYSSGGAAPDGVPPGADLTLRECTVIGKVHARTLRLASNTIFFARLAATDTPPDAPLRVQRKQDGCVRFSYVPTGSITPRRHRCQPDTEHPDALPHFTSLRYGDPGYCQLRSATARAIRQGADDEGEMGVMHALFQPQRETNLRIRLDEYLRFGLRAGLFYAT